jgi:hypothetical protein
MALRQSALWILTAITLVTLTRAWSAAPEATKPSALANAHASLKAYPSAIISLKNPKTGNLFYVESNGRRIVAFNRDGNVLWNVDVFETLPNVRLVGAPVIRDLKFDHDHLAVTIAKHAYAEVDLQKGNVKFLGAD